jgi:uncharacterized protein (TIGR04255 family)
VGKRMVDAPVFFTIGQVQHNPLLNLESYVPSIQENLRKVGYPDFKRGSQVSLELSATLSGGEAQPIAPPVTHKVDHYAFLNSEATWCLLLATSSVSLITTNYDTFEKFLPELKRGLTILSEAVGGLSYMERIGLRYVNAIVPKPGETLEQYLVAEVRGLPARLPEKQFRYSFAESASQTTEGHQIVSRTIAQSAPLGFPADLQFQTVKIAPRFSGVTGEHAVIDTDGSINQRRPFAIDEVEAQLTKLHDLNHEIFQSSVTDHARTAWGHQS